ncbi:hypothetical protein EC9_12500 [Rosistilla ulvae]|uniref:DUF3299 domain-containing protein n=1 Tax=Rosistilla ulvae TaxID=1930277 RepID=A0A517LWR6_9BACT|nr:DUF3299 domain-containing protein [Rosistilla ulvae]QDS87074.1 hypothetical protein EC9_12500 [Rosistilla ulvae]
MSATADTVDYPYRALSKLAIASVSLFIVGLLGLVPLFEPILSLAMIGAACGIFAVRSIKQFPEEYGGLMLAQTGIFLNVALMVGGIAEHTYIYLTEVPEGYQRVGFYELERTKGPDAPTEKAIEIDGEDIFLKGYIHPASGEGALKQFILVPDLGTCCFGGQPRSSSMIEVTLTGTKTVRYGRTKMKLAGQFELNKSLRTKKDIDNILFYRLRADYVKQ